MDQQPAEFRFTDLLPTGPDATSYRQLSTGGVSTFEAGGSTFLRVDSAAITMLTATAIRDRSEDTRLNSSHLRLSRMPSSA